MDQEEIIVVPESPRHLGTQELFVYIPVATNENKGIASFSQQFAVIDGKVHLIEDESFIGAKYIFDTTGETFTDGTHTINIERRSTSTDSNQIPLKEGTTIIIVSTLDNNWNDADYIKFAYTDKGNHTYTMNVSTPDKFDNTDLLLTVKDFKKYVYGNSTYNSTKIKFVGKFTYLNNRLLLNDFNKEYVDDNFKNLTFLTSPQKAALNSGIDGTKVNQITTNKNDITTLQGKVSAIEDRVPSFSSPTDKFAKQSDVTAIENKIPEGTTSSNQMVNESRMQSFVNSSINALAAYYITRDAQGDPFRTKAELNAAGTYYSGGQVRTPTTNDYCIVQADESKATSVAGYTSFTTTDEYVGYRIIYNYDDTLVTEDNKDTLGIIPGTTICYYTIPTTRYSYQGIYGEGGQWSFLYIINDTSLTAAQLAAINSGITKAKVTQIQLNTIALQTKANQTEVNALSATVNLKQDIIKNGTATLDFTSASWDSTNKVYTLDLSGTPWNKTLAKTNITLYKPTLSTKSDTITNTENLQFNTIVFVEDLGTSIKLYFNDIPNVNTLFIGVEVY